MDAEVVYTQKKNMPTSSSSLTTYDTDMQPLSSKPLLDLSDISEFPSNSSTDEEYLPRANKRRVPTRKAGSNKLV